MNIQLQWILGHAKWKKPWLVVLLVAVQLCVLHSDLRGQAVERQVGALSLGELRQAVQERGSAARGAVLFHGAQLGCGRCHSVHNGGAQGLGPNLAMPLKKTGIEHLLASLLTPSKEIAPEYQATQILTQDGDVLTGFVVKESAEQVELQSADSLQPQKISREAIDAMKRVETSLMPSGLLASLPNVRDAFDLLRYITEIQAGGFAAARNLQPTAAQLAIKLPDYEAHIDHRGFIDDWDAESLKRGQRVYEGLCINCHGTRQKPGSLATALRFGEGKFKYGRDPYAMYQTLTRGAGMMLPQPWMVPQQKYDVIHYIREHFKTSGSEELKPEYLAQLPMGSERGPEPQELEIWSQADYGPRLIGTYEIGAGGRNIAAKGIAIQLDGAPGGVAHGNAWAIFDHDTMRLAGVWTSREFIDWQGINFNGRHGIHPHIAGDILLENPTGPGWAQPRTGNLADDARVVGRDAKRYGPLPESWARYDGLQQQGRQTRIDYHVGNTPVSETFQWIAPTQAAAHGSTTKSPGAFVRNLSFGQRDESLQLVVATAPSGQTWQVDGGKAWTESEIQPKVDANQFAGKSYFQSEAIQDWDTAGADFSVVARITSLADGTIFSIAPREGPWAANGQTLFIRGGRLTYDVGWVGQVQASARIDDGREHIVGLTYNESSGLAGLWVDGRRVQEKRLAPKESLESPVLRIGKTCSNFPKTSTLDRASIASVQLFNRELSGDELSSLSGLTDSAGLVEAWQLAGAADPNRVVGLRGNDVLRTDGSSDSSRPELRCGVSGQLASGAAFHTRDQQLVLEIPAGTEPGTLRVWSASGGKALAGTRLERMLDEHTAMGMPVDSEPLFSTAVHTKVPATQDSGHGFAVDNLSLPKQNPWNAQLRLTGIDFYSDPDRLAVCTWDGDVWEVSGLASSKTAGAQLSWRRIAFGLFQPLGLKIIQDKIYLTCRDQLVRLDDTDGDGMTDYYHCVNNDHQVTEHFHEFAMGLQTDSAGNFYYAKSARHALPAIVPHHGTLLRVPADGSRTDIIATGFRAANGVCINPDGTFIVTDQEGHWNPKNRINWVHEGGFYGNMLGYHDVTDAADSAMQQPLCWITNAFDRSPAELLWCDSSAWGPFKGSLLNLSYGYGKIFVVPHEHLGQQVQGGMCSLPIADLPTGIIRGRFSPHDGQLYLCGLSAWATSQTAEKGGLYRIRYTGQPACLPTGIEAQSDSLVITFSEALGVDTPLEPSRQQVRTWSLRRTKNYGSKHYDEHELQIACVVLSDDRRSMRLEIPGLQPTWSMEIRLNVHNQNGQLVERVIHNTIHQTGADGG